MNSDDKRYMWKDNRVTNPDDTFHLRLMFWLGMSIGLVAGCLLTLISN